MRTPHVQAVVFLAVLTVCSLTFATSARATNTSFWYLQNPRPTAAQLTDCAFFDDGHGLAIGADGTVLQTHDGGAHWQLDRDAVGGNYLAALSTVGTSTVFLAGDPGGVIRVSYDAGASWSLLYTGDTDAIKSVLFVSASEGWAGTTHGTLWHTTDGGATWQRMDIHAPDPSWVNALAVSGGRMVVGCSSYLGVSSDGGATWTWTYYPVPTYTIPGVVRSITFSDADHAVVVDTYGWAVTTSDGGATWTRATTQLSSLGEAPALAFKDPLHGYVAGSGFTNGMNSGLRFWTTSDAGATWKIILPRFIDNTGAVTVPPVLATSVHFADSDLGWMTDSFGGVYYTLNGGAVWCRATETFTQESFHDAQFLDEANGFLVGTLDHTGNSGADVWVTHDEGASWASVLHDDSASLNAIALAPSGAGWAVGTNRLYRRGADGRWSNQYASGMWYVDVCTNDGVEAWLTGGLGTIMHTTDGGATWAHEDSNAWGFSGPAAVGAIVVRPNGKGWVCGNYGLENAVLKTADRGATWTKADSFPANTFKVIALDGQRLIAGTGSGVFASDDDGATWANVYSGNAVLDVSFEDTQRGYLRTSGPGPYTSSWTSGNVFTTTDGGRSWIGGYAPGIRGNHIVGFGDSIWVFGGGGEIAFNGGDVAHLPPPTTHTNAESGWSSTPFDLRLWGTDPIGVEDTFAQVDASSTPASSTATPSFRSLAFSAGGVHTGYSAWKFPVSMTKQGTTEIHYYSVSLDGAVETPRVAYIRIDMTAPAVRVRPAAAYWRKAIVRVTASDPYSGVKAIEWSVDGGKWRSLPRNVVNVTITKVGHHSIRVRAIDRVGHRTKTITTRRFTIRR